MEAKTEVTQLSTVIEEIYNSQFELMEQMALVMLRLTEIESSKAIGSGLKALYPDNLTIDDIHLLFVVSVMSYKIILSTNIGMLCDIMEYQAGRKLSDCKGLSTDIDTLLSSNGPRCYPEYQYISVPSKPSFNESDEYTWIDLSKLYKGETIHFQIPVDRFKKFDSERNNVFFVTGMEIYLPVVSQQERRVRLLKKQDM